MRARKVIVVVGMKNVGKTTTLLNIARSQKQRVLIFDKNSEMAYNGIEYLKPSEIKNFQGVKKCYHSDVEGFLTWLKKYYRNGLLVLEDATAYVRSRSNRPLNDMLVSCRHYGLDIILVFHSLTAVPSEIYPLTDTIILFKTEQSPEKVLSANKIPQADRILADFKEVNGHESRHYKKIIELNNR
jgi:molybdopterin-guanine dinucleotide biosynthesis protein